MQAILTSILCICLRSFIAYVVVFEPKYSRLLLSPGPHLLAFADYQYQSARSFITHTHTDTYISWLTIKKNHQLLTDVNQIYINCDTVISANSAVLNEIFAEIVYS